MQLGFAVMGVLGVVVYCAGLHCCGPPNAPTAGSELVVVATIVE